MPDERRSTCGRSTALDEGRSPSVDGTEAGDGPLPAAAARGRAVRRYTSAVKRLDPPRLFESRPSYRLLGAPLTGGRLGSASRRTSTSSTSPRPSATSWRPSAWRPALRRAGPACAAALPFRDLIGDPFDLHRRAVIPAITTLTIRLRRYPAEPSFLLHWRDPARSPPPAASMTSFRPASSSRPASRCGTGATTSTCGATSFASTLRSCSVRPSTTAPAAGRSTTRLAALPRAGATPGDGAVTAFVLGLGLDALTLAATILTVVVIDDDVFGAAFGRWPLQRGGRDRRGRRRRRRGRAVHRAGA